MEATAPPTHQQTLSTLVRTGRELLAQAGIEHADREVAWILQSAFACTRLELILEGARGVSQEEWERAWALLSRRAAREPLQYVLGSQEFLGRDFTVDEHVLIPRQETEVLVEEVIRSCQAFEQPVIADIGTGSGCVAISLALALPHSLIYATDVSGTALDMARRNAGRHAVEHRVRFLEGDLGAPLREAGLTGLLTAVVSNPPYIAEREFPALQPEVRTYEPRLALAGGVEGLDVHRRLIDETADLLLPGGLLVMEVGDRQAGMVTRLAEECGRYDKTWMRQDGGGIERIVGLRRAGQTA
jgi:release factor glutamine methyltransferase